MEITHERFRLFVPSCQNSDPCPHYQPFLETPDQENILLAQKKKSVKDLLFILQQVALKAIQRLSQSHCFLGEIKWQTAFAQYESQLKNPTLSVYSLCIALCQVDDLIEIASVMQTVRKDIWEMAKRQATLSVEREQKYTEIQKQYLERREVLVTLENQVRQVGKTYSQLTGQSHLTDSSADFVVIQSVPKELPTYHQDTVNTRFSENHIQHLVRVEECARIVYQDLVRETNRPSITEKLSDEIQSGQHRLHTKAEKILKTADDLRQQIQRDSSRMIEHRTQTLLAQANRIEQLSMTLEKVIQRLNHYLAHHPSTQKQGSGKQTQLLLLIVNEAQLTQDHLQKPSHVINTQQVQNHILTLEQHRKDYAKTLTGWGSFFGKSLSTHRQQETINQTIQSHLAELVVPACGLQDRQGIATVEQIKNQQIYGKQLAHQTDQIQAETKKIQELSHDFSATHCQP